MKTEGEFLNGVFYKMGFVCLIFSLGMIIILYLGEPKDSMYYSSAILFLIGFFSYVIPEFFTKLALKNKK